MLFTFPLRFFLWLPSFLPPYLSGELSCPSDLLVNSLMAASRRRFAPAIRFILLLSWPERTSSFSASVRLRFLIEIGTRTVMVRPSLLIFGRKGACSRDAPRCWSGGLSGWRRPRRCWPGSSCAVAAGTATRRSAFVIRSSNSSPAPSRCSLRGGSGCHRKRCSRLAFAVACWWSSSPTTMRKSSPTKSSSPG